MTGILAACLVGALGVRAQGELVTVTFDGLVSYRHLSVSSRFNEDDLMHVSITYESTTPDPWWSIPTTMGYYPAITAFSLSVASDTPYTASATSGYFALYNDYGDSEHPLVDTLEAVVQSFDDLWRDGTLVGDPVNGMDLWRFHLYLHDSTATALDSDALPTAIDPALFQTTTLSLEWRRITDYGTFNEGIYVDEFHVVPLPGALALAALGIGTSSWICRRRRA
jgi:hypothetical protein